MRRLRAHEAGEVESTLGAEINGAWYSDPLPTREDAAKFEAALKSLRDSRSPLFTEYTTGLPPVPWRGWNARVDEPVVSERYSRVGPFSSSGSVSDPVRRRRFSDSRGPEGVFRRSSGVGAKRRKDEAMWSRYAGRSYGNVLVLALLIVLVLAVVGVSVLLGRDDRGRVLELFDFPGAEALDEERGIIEDADRVVWKSCVFDERVDESTGSVGSAVEVEVDGVIRGYFVHFRDVC